MLKRKTQSARNGGQQQGQQGYQQNWQQYPQGNQGYGNYGYGIFLRRKAKKKRLAFKTLSSISQ